MPYRDGYFGPWPSGPDFESATPAMWVELDRDLGSRTRYIAQDVTERNTVFPSSQLGTNNLPIVSIPSLKQEHRWDGQRWLIFDSVPEVVAGYVTDGVDLTPFSLGNGGSVWATYQRRGHWCDMTMMTYWGSGADAGAEPLIWYLKYEPADLYQTGSAVWRNPSTASWSGALSLTDGHHFAVAEAGGRWLARTHSPTADTYLSFQMTYRLKV